MVIAAWLVAAGLFSLNVAQYLVQLSWHARVDAAKEAESKARQAAVWWQARATSGTVRIVGADLARNVVVGDVLGYSSGDGSTPPPLPEEIERVPFWQRAVTMCMPRT